MKKEKRFFILWLVLSLCWIVFIFLHSLKPAEISSKESLGVLAFLQNFFPDLSHHLVRKLGHFVEFTVLGFFLFQTFSRGFKILKNEKLQKPVFSFFAALVWGLAVAACDEWIQTGVPGRSGKIADVLLDMSGVMTGILLSFGIMLLLRKRKKI